MPLSHSLNVIFGAAAVSGASVRRDRRRLVVLFLLPTLVMAIVGFAMGGYSSASFEVGLVRPSEYEREPGARRGAGIQ